MAAPLMEPEAAEYNQFNFDERIARDEVVVER